MPHTYKDSIKPFIRREILQTVSLLDITQEQAAEILGIDVRSFAYLAAGKTMCSATTLLVYLTTICPNPLAFIEELGAIIKEAKLNMA